MHNTSAYQRRVAAKGTAAGARPMTRPRGPPGTGGVSAGVSRPPVNGVAPAGAGMPPVNGGAPAGVSAAWSSEISVLHNGLIVMQPQVRAMLAVPPGDCGGSSKRGLRGGLADDESL